jgi:hypothetical protein
MTGSTTPVIVKAGSGTSAAMIGAIPVLDCHVHVLRSLRPLLPVPMSFPALLSGHE